MAARFHPAPVSRASSAAGQASGFLNSPPSAATPLAIATAAGHGLHLEGHRARALTPRLVREADLILAMEPRHAEWARSLAPDARDRVHLVTEQGPEGGASEAGVRDPLGGTAEEYADTFHLIRSHLLRWVPLIRGEIERREGVR